MADTRQIVSSDGRHRVAYEMALTMWRESNNQAFPKVEDREDFLKLVSDCTRALAHHHA